LQAKVGEHLVLAGKPELWTERAVALPDDLLAAFSGLAKQGKTVVFVGRSDRAIGIVAIADALRTEAPIAIANLRDAHIEHMTMLTGDSPTVAATIASQLGLSFQAGLMPDEKLRCIKSLRDQYGEVAMMGDGINDAPSLASASVGISLGGTGTDVALETADVVLMSDDLRHLAYAIALARQTQRIIQQNLIFAFGMMCLLLVATFSTSLRLPLAVLGHEGSTVLVILNGLRLLSFPRPQK
jgi:Cd2+/Zn2+-exporting ATPase